VADPFVAEIRIFPFNFAPKGWAFCNGQILPISQNTALFSLLGTTYGGDGRSNFALPNIQGRVPMHPGQGPGLSPYTLGQAAGEDGVVLTLPQMGSHRHTLEGSTITGGNTAPSGESLGNSGATPLYQTATTTNLVNLNTKGISTVGAGAAHNNLMPYLTVNFCIALQGVFPPRP
jgi:microcystin-dependent protein